MERWNQGIDQLTRREPRELISSKAGGTSEIMGTFQVHSSKTRITRARTPDSPTIEPILPSPYIYTVVSEVKLVVRKTRKVVLPTSDMNEPKTYLDEKKQILIIQ